MRNTITLNGVESSTISGLLIQELPAISKPLMRTEVETIDGRDGDITTNLGFSAYDKQISIGLFGEFDINQVIAYFNSKGTVVFSNEPDKFYNYEIVDQIDFERLVRYRTATVKFHCQPFKYAENEGVKILGDYNLIPFPTYSQTINGVTLTIVEDSIHIIGEATNAITFDVPLTNFTLTPGDYTMEVYADGFGMEGSIMRVSYSPHGDATAFGKTAVVLQNDQLITVHDTFEENTTFTALRFWIPSGAMTDFVVGVDISDDSSRIVSGEGNFIALHGTSESTFSSLEIDGDTYQQTYSGKNLFNKNSGQIINAYEDSTEIHSNNSTRIVYVKCEPNTTYTVSKIQSARFGVAYTEALPANGVAVYGYLQNNTATSITISTGNSAAYLSIYLYHSSYDTLTVDEILDSLQVEKGSTATDYEKYVGGIKSPNPDYPQSVQTVTGLQNIKITGKNLLPAIARGGTYNGLTSTVENGKIKIEGTATAEWCGLSANIPAFIPAGTKITLSITDLLPGQTRFYMRLYRELGGAYSYMQTPLRGKKTTYTTWHDVYGFQYYIHTEPGTEINMIFGIQLEYGENATDFEIYQEQRRPINLGKNLFNGSIYKTGYTIDSEGNEVVNTNGVITNTIKVEPGVRYTVSSFMTSSSGDPYIRICYYTGDMTFISRNSKVSPFNSPTPENAVYVRLAYSQSTHSDVQFEKGSTATAYAEYFEPIELCKLGNYQDRIYKDGDDWKLYKAIGSHTFDASAEETWSKSGNSTNVSFVATLSHLENFLATPNNAEIGALSKSDYFSWIAANSIKNSIGKITCYNDAEGAYLYLAMSLDAENITNITEAKAWLSSHPTTIYAVLLNPTTTIITNQALIAQLNAIASSHGYEESTSITVDTAANNIPGILKVSLSKHGSETVVNSGNYISRPVITIYGEGDIGLYIGQNQVFQIALGDEGHITIDGAAMEAYKDSKDNLKNRLVTGDYKNFVLQPGSNTIRFAGNVDRAVIEHYSRWL